MLRPSSSVLQQYNSSNPIAWWGITWDTQVNTCQFHIDGNSTQTIAIGVGGGGGYWSGSPPPVTINSLSEVSFTQFCVEVQAVDGKNTIPIEWKQHASQTCDGN
jgi:hypothetical protein